MKCKFIHPPPSLAQNRVKLLFKNFNIPKLTWVFSIHYRVIIVTFEGIQCVFQEVSLSPYFCPKGQEFTFELRFESSRHFESGGVCPLIMGCQSLRQYIPFVVIRLRIYQGVLKLQKTLDYFAAELHIAVSVPKSPHTKFQEFSYYLQERPPLLIL